VRGRAAAVISWTGYMQFTKGPSVASQIGWSDGQTLFAQVQSNVFFGHGIGAQPTDIAAIPTPTRTHTCVAGSQFAAPHWMGPLFPPQRAALTFQCPAWQSAKCCGPIVGQLPG
jgi:hypothetical protein